MSLLFMCAVAQVVDVVAATPPLRSWPLSIPLRFRVHCLLGFGRGRAVAEVVVGALGTNNTSGIISSAKTEMRQAKKVVRRRGHGNVDAAS